MDRPSRRRAGLRPRRRSCPSRRAALADHAVRDRLGAGAGPRSGPAERGAGIGLEGRRHHWRHRAPGAARCGRARRARAGGRDACAAVGHAAAGRARRGVGADAHGAGRARAGAPGLGPAAPCARCVARHRQPRHRPPAAPALSQCAHAGARARRIPGGRSPAGCGRPCATGRPRAPDRRAAGPAWCGGSRRPPGPHGTRAHRGAGPGGAARSGTVVRAAAHRQQRAAQCRVAGLAAGRQRPGAHGAPRGRDAGPGRRASQRPGAARTGPGRWTRRRRRT